jgi:hypothetical protein
MRVETIYEFIRFSIDDRVQNFESAEDLDWEALFDFAKRQTIVGVLFAGVEKMPEGKRPPKNILMQWFVLVERIKAKNKELNEAVIEVTSRFRKDGFPNCVLKGQGNALMYPHPELRMPGDIDLWPLAEREQIYKYVRKDFPQTEMLYHHLEYPIMKGIVTEVHFSPMFLNNPLYNSRFQKWLKSVGEQQCENWVKLPQGSFSRPTDEFNMVYQLAHIRHHLFDEGIGLRQLMDYYFLLRQVENGKVNVESVKETLRSVGLFQFAGAVMYVMQEVFGLDSQCLLAQPNEKIGKILEEEILMTGNFGHHDLRFGDLKNASRPKRLLMLLKKNLRFGWYFPDEVVCAFFFRLGQPIWRWWAMCKYSR